MHAQLTLPSQTDLASGDFAPNQACFLQSSNRVTVSNNTKALGHETLYCFLTVCISQDFLGHKFYSLDKPRWGTFSHRSLATGFFLTFHICLHVAVSSPYSALIALYSQLGKRELWSSICFLFLFNTRPQLLGCAICIHGESSLFS